MKKILIWILALVSLAIVSNFFFFSEPKKKEKISIKKQVEKKPQIEKKKDRRES